MANVDRKWIAPAVIAAAFAASSVAYLRLPPTVTLSVGALLPFPVPDSADPASRWLAAFLIPSIAAVLWVGFRFAATPRAQQAGWHLFPGAPAEATSAAQFARFDTTYETIVLGVVLLVLGLHAGLLAAAFQHPAMAARIMGLTLAVFMIAVGNVLPRLRPNWVAGLRAKHVLSDPDVWRTTHRVFGAALVASGVLTLIVAFTAPSYALVAGIGLVVLSCLAGLMASRRVSAGPPLSDAKQT